MSRFFLTAYLVSIFLAPVLANASDDWPTFAHDGHRSAATEHVLDLPLHKAWTHRAEQLPTPAWPPPARFDYWHYKENLQPRVTFDHAYHPVAVDDRIYYGGSTDDSLVCLDARTGHLQWRFFTEGPVRLAPTISDGRLYAGSDDGNVYCLDAVTGQLLWKERIGPHASCCLGNERMISRWPVRSGVLVDDGIAYAAAGLFPTTEGTYLVGLDADTGARVSEHPVQQSVQGYMLLMSQQLILPSGRTAPMAYRRGDGQPLGELASPGGAYTVLSTDVMVAGRGDTDGELALAHPETREHLFTLQGLHLIAHGTRLYVHGRSSLAALDRARFLPLAQQYAKVRQQRDTIKKQKGSAAKAELAQLEARLAAVHEEMQDCWLWKTDCDHSESLILAGDKLFAGGHQSVLAFDAQSGAVAWQGDVDGRACGLAAARGRLLVSTDQGTIHAFGGETPGTSSVQDNTPPRSNNPSEQQQAWAREIREATRADQGYCLIVGDDVADLAAELANTTRLHIIVAQRREETIVATRALLATQGLYGPRVVVHHHGGGTYPYPPYFANLIIVTDPSETSDRIAELRRLVRPEGGSLCMRGSVVPGDQFPAEQFTRLEHATNNEHWTVWQRGTLPGSGQWTHGLADPGNTACSQDQLVRGPLRIQWFGRPGPRPMADRHHRNVPPLYHGGRLYVPGDNLVIAADAYNGTQLWLKEIPQSLRLGAFLDCSNMVADERALRVTAGHTCHVLQPETGATLQEIKLPQLMPDQPHSWGYLARAEQLVIGSGRKPEAAYYRQSREDDLALWFDNMSLVTSDYLFALPAESDQPAWTYRSGVIINTTITIGGGRIYFLESQAAEALNNSLGRMPMSTFAKGECLLVALDLRTGEVLWKRPFDLANCQHIVYMNYAQEKLLVSGNRYVNRSLWYFFEAIDARSGQDVWQARHDSKYRPGGDHGEQNRHPTIVGDTVYTYPLAYDLHSGEQREGWVFDRLGHGCGNISASAGCMFWRGGNPWQWDLQAAAQPMRINSVNRPGCFINLIPAGGLLLMPEASSGCTCGFPLQTSLAYVPAALIGGGGQHAP